VEFKRGSVVGSETSGLLYASPPMAGTSPPSSQGGLMPISSDEYEDAED